MPKQRHILILAGGPQEAVTYARRKGLPARTYRCVASASSIRGIQVADVHILPEFYRRRDSHAIMAELRWGRDIQKFHVEMPEPAIPDPVDQGDGMGEQLDILSELERPAQVVPELLELANRVREQNGSEAGAPEQVESAAPPAPRRRRSRCGECGALHFAEDPCAPVDDRMFA